MKNLNFADHYPMKSMRVTYETVIPTFSNQEFCCFQMKFILKFNINADKYPNPMFNSMKVGLHFNI